MGARGMSRGAGAGDVWGPRPRGAFPYMHAGPPKKAASQRRPPFPRFEDSRHHDHRRRLRHPQRLDPDDRRLGGRSEPALPRPQSRQDRGRNPSRTSSPPRGPRAPSASQSNTALGGSPLRAFARIVLGSDAASRLLGQLPLLRLWHRGGSSLRRCDYHPNRQRGRSRHLSHRRCNPPRTPAPSFICPPPSRHGGTTLFTPAPLFRLSMQKPKRTPSVKGMPCRRAL